ncbi:MAG: hypothetical protein HYS27_08000 [Deltaproteobacteria bacterium]|nr:hypothetical protein [Deltaproteobacteria bacterium]
MASCAPPLLVSRPQQKRGKTKMRALPWKPILIGVLVVGVVATALSLGATDLIDDLAYEPPAPVAGEQGGTSAICRGEIYEGNRRIATDEDVAAMTRTTCVRGDLTIGVERCERASRSGAAATASVSTLRQLKRLEVVTGVVRIQGLRGLKEVREFRRLVAVGGFELCDTGELVVVDLPALKGTPSLVVGQRTAVTEIRIPLVDAIQRLQVSGSSPLEKLVTKAGAAIGLVHVAVEMLDSTPAGAGDVPWLASVESVDQLEIAAFSNLRTVTLPKLASARAITIGGKNLGTISAPLLARVDSLRVSDVPALTAIDAPALAGTVSNLLFDRAPTLRQVNLGPVVSVTQLTVSRTGLQSLAFLDQVSSFQRLTVQENAELTTLGLRSLHAIGSNASGEISKNPRLTAAGRDELEALATGTKLKICENAEQPPCAWNHQTFPRRRVQDPGESLTLDGVKLMVPHGRRLESGAPAIAALLKGSPGFQSQAVYHIYQEGFSTVAVKYLEGVAVELLPLPSHSAVNEVPAVKLPRSSAFESIALFDLFGGYCIVGKQRRRDGAFVVGVVLADRTGGTDLGEVNVTELARDPAIATRGLDGVLVARAVGQSGVHVAFAANPADMTFPNLPLVMEQRGGQLVPVASYQTARTQP